MSELKNESLFVRKLFSNGFEIDTDPSRFGWLRDSTELLDDSIALCERIESDGYLYLPGFLDRSDVRNARMMICQVLALEGSVDENYPIDKAVAKAETEMRLRTDIANRSPVKAVLDELTLSPRIMTLVENLLGSYPAKRFPWIWLRTMTPGKGTAFHCDIVYMGRGTHNLYTSWIPLGDITLNVGGLILLEDSNRNKVLHQSYCMMDADVLCMNGTDNQSQLNAAGYPGYGALSLNPTSVQKQLGGRILTAREFKMGDFLIFSAFTVHGSLDNESNEIRLSVDTRYQLQNEPTDERWLNPNPENRLVKYTIC